MYMEWHLFLLRIRPASIHDIEIWLILEIANDTFTVAIVVILARKQTAKAISCLVLSGMNSSEKSEFALCE